MTKCDFCEMSSPKGKCFWSVQALREEDCNKAVKRMIMAFGHADGKKHRKEDMDEAEE